MRVIFMTSELTPSEKLLKVVKLAMNAHAGQYRKYSGVPYLCHPLEVATKLGEFLFFHRESLGISRLMCAEMMYAAVAHDILEDCPNTTEEMISEASSDTALYLVKALTNPSKDSTLPRAERKKMDRDHLKGASVYAKMIKLVDRTCNLRDLSLCPDNDFKLKYASESRLLLEECLRNVNKVLEDELELAINELEESCNGTNV